VNPTFTSRIVELDRRESAHLLALLFEHASALEHVVRHHWVQGDVAMWDNRSTMHYAVRDYDNVERVLHRVTIRGDRPF
jgi:taurine dioxygenase